MRCLNTITVIAGLVTLRSSGGRMNRKPIGERASSKLRVPAPAAPDAATKPKARSPMGFVRSGRQETDSARENPRRETGNLQALSRASADRQSEQRQRVVASTTIATPSPNRFPSATRQGASANGPIWAAPLYIDWQRANRMRTTNACVPDLVEVLEQEGWDCDNALAPFPMNRPSLALGDRDDR